MKKYLMPLIPILVFNILQAIGGVIAFAIDAISDIDKATAAFKTHDQAAIMGIMTPEALAWTVAITGVISVAIISLFKLINWKTVVNFKQVDWKWAIIGLVGALVGVFASDILEEMLDLPNILEDQFISISQTTIGFIAIGIVGPIVEEFIFRESILGYMTRKGVNKWTAIIISAVIFGLIHGNPAQVVFAGIMGIVLGILYYKTGNIILPAILHMINNSVSVIIMASMGEDSKDASLVDLIGGQTSAIINIIACSVICAAILYLFWKNCKTPKLEISEE